MTIYRRAAQRDPGETIIVGALRAAGAFVWRLSAEGLPDLLVGHRKRWLLLEVKAPPGPRGGASEHGQKLSEAQQKFFADAELGELPAYVVRSPEEALRAIGVQIVEPQPNGGPSGALSFLNEQLGNDGAAGVIVAAVDERGGIDLRVFGCVPRYSLAYAGAVLADYSVNGEFEEA